MRSSGADDPTDASRSDASDRAPVRLGPEILERYARFSLYNSPYRAHDEGRAIDLYPASPADGRTTVAPSPVAGTVREVRSVRAPPKPYAAERDHLLVIDCEAPPSVAGLTARILHVDPALEEDDPLEAGDSVATGDDLGTLVRAGFFAPWVDNHLHVGFRPPDRDPLRASGSLPIEPEVSIRPLEWDGTGTVVRTGETYAVLDAPGHPSPGAGFVGITADGGGVLDGGLPHYDGGGLLGTSGVSGALADGETGTGSASRSSNGAVRLLGERAGVATGRTIAWDDVTVTANGDPVTGLSCFCARDGDFGAKLICPDRSFAVGTEVDVRLERAD